MSEYQRTHLEARLDRIELQLTHLANELAAVRRLAGGAEAPAPQERPPTSPHAAQQPPPPAPPAPPEPEPARVGPRRQFPPTPAPATVSAAAPAGITTKPAPVRWTTAPPPSPPRRTVGQLARDWDLVGPRGFAIVGGAVTALGIGLFFVLAANRGWIDERARVALGAAASALVFGAGVVLRARYGQYWSALAAVGAGIAGAYATLAAAAVRYDLVPDALALPLAGAIAALGTVVAVRWRSQVIAALGLLGAALAPALQSLDTEMTWESAAFALIVLVAAASVAVPRDWVPLLGAATALVAVQVEWLVLESEAPAEPGTVAVASAFCLLLLGIAVGRQLAAAHEELDPLALSYATGAFAAALLLSLQLFEERGDRGAALLGASAVWALVFAALHVRRLPDLGLVVGVSALALVAVGMAFALVGGTLTVVWAAESIVLAVIAWRIGDARLRALAIGYAALASVHALATDGSLGRIFDETGDAGAGVLPLASAALAAAATGLLAPERYAARTETGLLAFVRDLRLGLERHRGGIAEALCFTGTALATLAASFALVAASYENGHLAATYLAAGIGALVLTAAALRRSTGLAIAGYAWLGAVLVEAFVDADRFYDDVTALSSGGWALVGAAAGLLAGAYVHRALDPGRRGADWLLGIISAVVALSVTAGVALVTETLSAFGAGMVAVSVAYAALAAGVFRADTLRTAATILWAFGLVFLVAAEAALVTDDVWRTVAIVLTGLAVGALARPLAEMRLWLAGGALALLTSALALLAQVQPWLLEGELERREALVAAACAVALLGLAALVWGEDRWRDPATLLWAAGVLAVLATERVVIGDLRWTAFTAALTGALLAVLSRPLAEERLWLAGAVVAGGATIAAVGEWTPLSQLFVDSQSPAAGVWVLAAGIVALAVVAATAPDARTGIAVGAVAGGLALYAVSLVVLEVAVRVSSASVETDFERGHTAVSAVWALVGLALLVVGLLRGSAAIRYGGLALFGLSLAKIFLYDLAELSSVARAFSFILVGGLLLAGGFFLQRLSDRIGPPRPPDAPTASD